LSNTVELVQTAASIATAVGVLLAGWQLWLTKRQAVTQFEDQLASQYRAIARELPVEALLGEPLDEQEYRKALPILYHYFDLSNEQAFLHHQRRIRAKTWIDWQEGIVQNLRRPAFKQAWIEVSTRAPESFNELRAYLPKTMTAPTLPEISDTQTAA